MAKSGSTIVLTTQYLEEADQLADRIGIIDNGKLIKIGTASELKNELSQTQLEIQLINNEQINEATNLVESLTTSDVRILPEQNSFSIKIEDVNLTIEILNQLHI